MEQKDYLLREIEKIGMLISMIFNKIAGGKENLAVAIENQFDEAKELMFKESGFDLDLFISLENQEIKEYLSGFIGMQGVNIESLADLLKEMGLKTYTPLTKEYLDKALYLYEMCNSTDKTYSIERENKIGEVKIALYQKFH